MRGAGVTEYWSREGRVLLSTGHERGGYYWVLVMRGAGVTEYWS